MLQAEPAGTKKPSRQHATDDHQNSETVPSCVDKLYKSSKSHAIAPKMALTSSQPEHIKTKLYFIPVIVVNGPTSSGPNPKI